MLEAAIPSARPFRHGFFQSIDPARRRRRRRDLALVDRGRRRSRARRDRARPLRRKRCAGAAPRAHCGRAGRAVSLLRSAARAGGGRGARRGGALGARQRRRGGDARRAARRVGALRRLRAEGDRDPARLRRRRARRADHVRRRSAGRGRRPHRPAVRRPRRPVARSHVGGDRARPHAGLYRQRRAVAAAGQPHADAAGDGGVSAVRPPPDRAVGAAAARLPRRLGDPDAARRQGRHHARARRLA
jgi:hypothetical protein